MTGLVPPTLFVHLRTSRRSWRTYAENPLFVATKSQGTPLFFQTAGAVNTTPPPGAERVWSAVVSTGGLPADGGEWNFCSSSSRSLPSLPPWTASFGVSNAGPVLPRSRSSAESASQFFGVQYLSSR